jgi:hypothetical protein
LGSTSSLASDNCDDIPNILKAPFPILVNNSPALTGAEKTFPVANLSPKNQTDLTLRLF